MPWDSARAGPCFHDHTRPGHLQNSCSTMERLLSAQTDLQPANELTAETLTLHRPCKGFWKSRPPTSVALRNSCADRAHTACMTCTPARQCAAATVLRSRALQQTPTVTRRKGLFPALRLPEPAAPNQVSSSAAQLVQGSRKWRCTRRHGSMWHCRRANQPSRHGGATGQGGAPSPCRGRRCRPGQMIHR